MKNRMFTKAIWVNQIFIHKVLESTYVLNDTPVPYATKLLAALTDLMLD